MSLEGIYTEFKPRGTQGARGSGRGFCIGCEVFFPAFVPVNPRESPWRISGGRSSLSGRRGTQSAPHWPGRGERWCSVSASASTAGEKSTAVAPAAGPHSSGAAARRVQFSHSLLVTSTHDTKRSEDVRARIAALSEMPQEWARAVRHWQRINRCHRREISGEMAPDVNEEYLLYQTLLGSWPIAAMDREEHDAYMNRIQAYMVKALHEAKVNSSWVEPNAAWDKSVSAFVGAILESDRRNRFLPSFQPLARRIAEIGAINALSQTVLKLTVPGVPDIYQGNEMWDFSLVDPDNRRPVDYDLRRPSLAQIRTGVMATDLLESWSDGRIKLLVTTRLLQFRRDHPTLFSKGEYLPENAEGSLAENVIAFRRRTPEAEILVVTPRFSSQVAFPPIGEKWGETKLANELLGEWRELFTGATSKVGRPFRVADLMRDLPVAVWFTPLDQNRIPASDLVVKVSNWVGAPIAH